MFSSKAFYPLTQQARQEWLLSETEMGGGMVDIKDVALWFLLVILADSLNSLLPHPPLPTEFSLDSLFMHPLP